jgi:carbon storage regulator
MKVDRPQIIHGGFIMLVLTRKVGEKIFIDNSITVEVVSVQGNKVRIGITAPPKVRVDREEVHEARMEFVDIEADEPVVI